MERHIQNCRKAFRGRRFKTEEDEAIVNQAWAYDPFARDHSIREMVSKFAVHPTLYWRSEKSIGDRLKQDLMLQRA